MRISDWSSDVCSSDLTFHRPSPRHRAARAAHGVRLPSASNDDSHRRNAANRPRPHRAPKSILWPKGAANRMTEDTASAARSEEHTSELPSLMRTSYAVFCLKKKQTNIQLPWTQPTQDYTAPGQEHTPTLTNAH